MIPEQFLEFWREKANWKSLEHVEQDLLLSRVIVELYADSLLQESIALIGGTIINKAFLPRAMRYSEDLDFVYINPEPIGPVIDSIRQILDPLFGEPRRKVSKFGVRLVYRYVSENNLPMRFKLEINMTEKFNVLDLLHKPFAVESGWFSGESKITTYQFEELMASKLRALFHRSKGRDLFDVAYVFGNDLADILLTISVFQEYGKRMGNSVSGNRFTNNLLEKQRDELFRTDMDFLLPEGVPWEVDEAFEYVQNKVIVHLP